MSDHVRLELLGAHVYRAGDFEQRRRLKFYVCHRFTNAESIEECFQIQSAVNLEFGDVAFSIPIAATGEGAFPVAPFTMRDIQSLVVPFGRGGQIINFVAAPLQSVAAQGRLDPGVFELCHVSAELQLQRRRPCGETELLQFSHDTLGKRQSLLPFFRCD